MVIEWDVDRFIGKLKPDTPIFNSKKHGFRDFSLNQSIEMWEISIWGFHKWRYPQNSCLGEILWNPTKRDDFGGTPAL